MIRLGITGGIGSGKTTVSKLFEIRGFPVYVSDAESKSILLSSPVIRNKLIHAFGEWLYEGEKLNKAVFADLIFNDKNKLAIANSIIHPEVCLHYERWCDQMLAKKRFLIGLESAILYESGMSLLTDKILLVYTPLEERIKRTMIRDNLTREKIVERINNQDSDELKLNRADYVVYNDERQSIIKQVDCLIDNLLMSNG